MNLVSSKNLGIELMASSRKYRSKKRGIEAAKRHIEEARLLSKELGGSDKDVKAWLFSRTDSELSKILSAYRTHYGNKPADYAVKAFPDWKSGRIQMSGLVGGRIFSFLSPFMPITAKYDLVESLWNHVGPTRKRLITAGLNADKMELIKVVKQEVQSLTTNWVIPPELSARFKWLAGDDADAYQQLLSHITECEKKLGETVLEQQLPELSANFSQGIDDLGGRFSYVIEIKNQFIEIRLLGDSPVIAVSEWAPIAVTYPSNNSSSDLTYFFWILVVLIIVFLTI